MSRLEKYHYKNKIKEKNQLSKKDKFSNSNTKNIRNKSFRIFLRIICISILIIFIFFVYGALSTGIIQDPTGILKFQDQFNNGKVNMLILGSDIRPNEKNASRSDVIIIGSIDFKNGTVNLLSIPRDTRVSIPGIGEDKINHAYAFGGIDLTKKTIENFLNIEIDRYIEITFDSFKDIIDELGGIEIDIEEDMYYPEEGIDLIAGNQILNGKDALAYVRFRGTPTGDIGRVERQQRFIIALKASISKKADFFKKINIFSKLLKSIKNNISFQESIYMFLKYKDNKNFVLNTWISSGIPETINGISYMIPAYDAAKDDVQFLKGKLVSIKDLEDKENKKLVKSEEYK